MFKGNQEGSKGPRMPKRISLSCQGVQEGSYTFQGSLMMVTSCSRGVQNSTKGHQRECK